MHSIEALVEDVGEIVSFPQVYDEINRLLAAPSTDLGAIAALIGQDPGLTLKVLRMANSPLYGASREVDSVLRAITLLGEQQLREIILTTSASKVLAGIPNDVFVIDDFWRHSIFCGLVARFLAQRSARVEEDFAFVAGLLHDVGQLAYFNRYPGETRVVLELVMDAQGDMPLYEAEAKVFGFDHMALGGELLKAWHLPQRLRECVAYHHHPEQAEAFPAEVAIVHIANHLTYIEDVGVEKEVVCKRIHEQAWQNAGLDLSVIDEALAFAREQLGQVRSSLGLGR